jgi:hypothetical protein
MTKTNSIVNRERLVRCLDVCRGDRVVVLADAILASVEGGRQMTIMMTTTC